MKFLLVAINAKYIHTNLAVRHLQHYLQRQNSTAHTEILECTINEQLSTILEKIYACQPAVLCLSCYIWNYGIVRELVTEYKKIDPAVKILLGGPEVSFDAPEQMATHPEIDFILAGEGEIAFHAFTEAFRTTQQFETVPGLCYRDRDGHTVCTPPPPLLELEHLVYNWAETGSFANRIAYYEASRGCPYRCAYCLSAGEKVRLRPLELVKADLLKVLERGYMQLKFVDRTFNADRAFAKELWRFLIAHDNGYTNFHFEIAADILDAESVALLQSARAGLFQLEIGVQSTNEETLRAVSRHPKTDTILHNAKTLAEEQNINIHLDLIAGLPLEDYKSFAASFDNVFAARPHQLQLGFLKVLKGSPLAEKKLDYGIVHLSSPPYEVLATAHLSFADLIKLKQVEAVVDYYYNSGRFLHSLKLLGGFYTSPFAMFEELASFIYTHYESVNALGKLGAFEAMDAFFTAKGHDKSMLPHTTRLDIALNERPRKYPAHAQIDYPAHYRQATAERFEDETFLNTVLHNYTATYKKDLKNYFYTEVFPAGSLPDCETDTLYLFDYEHKDLFGHAKVIRCAL